MNSNGKPQLSTPLHRFNWRALAAVAAVIVCSAEHPLTANAATVAAQLDASTELTTWQSPGGTIPGTTPGSGNSTSTIVVLGTPFTSDQSITGLQYYMKSYDNGSNGSLEPGLFYMNTSTFALTPACVMQTAQTSHSLGTSTVNVSNSMQLVQVKCDGGVQVIDHTKTLVIAVWGLSLERRLTSLRNISESSPLGINPLQNLFVHVNIKPSGSVDAATQHITT